MFPDSSYTATPDGLELTFASNHLGQFLLTEMLIPTLQVWSLSDDLNVEFPYTIVNRDDLDSILIQNF